MVEKDSKRGRKPSVSQSKIQVIHTSKRAKLVINGEDEVTIPKGMNMLIVRDL